ncbi:MAG: neuromedin U, partial [Gammaproteobacteria bacterium]
LQLNTSLDWGPEEGTMNVLNIQPVLPFSNGKVNFINRTIMPVMQQPKLTPDGDSKFGLGDITHTVFISPAAPSAFTWGVGPVLTFPTATDDRLGVDAWSGGIGAVGLAMPGKWVVGALIQNVWSFSGDDDVNQLLFQYFINYNMEGGWYLTTAPIITANWEADSGERWTVPVGGGFGKIFRIGSQPMNAQFQAFYNIDKPDFVGDWSLRFQLQFLFPKGA